MNIIFIVICMTVIEYMCTVYSATLVRIQDTGTLRDSGRAWARLWLQMSGIFTIREQS